MKKEEFISYAQEVILTVLKITSTQLDKLREMGDISGEEILTEKVLLPYEKIYGALLEMKVDKMNEEEFNSFKDMVEEIREKNRLPLEKIQETLKKREELKNKSGAIVVKRFFKYNLNRLLDKKDKILNRYNQLATEQFDIIYKLQPVREKLRDTEDKYLVVEKDINQLKKKLESKWPYEIYGVVSEEELLETYKEAFKMED